MFSKDVFNILGTRLCRSKSQKSSNGCFVFYAWQITTMKILRERFELFFSIFTRAPGHIPWTRTMFHFREQCSPTHDELVYKATSSYETRRWHSLMPSGFSQVRLFLKTWSLKKDEKNTLPSFFPLSLSLNSIPLAFFLGRLQRCLYFIIA